ncbi:MAG: hypothetical protein P8L46_10210 [Acidimicrobiales bacterium]|nr:hypothetical protein [Acidimicrobiales bacterium]
MLEIVGVVAVDPLRQERTPEHVGLSVRGVEAAREKAEGRA